MQYAILAFQRPTGEDSVIKISQGEEIGTHVYTRNNDYCGYDTGKDYMLAPFDCIVRAIRTYDNQVLFENLKPVMTPSGLKEHFCFTATHMVDADLNDLGIKIGKKFIQGERCYREGTKGIGSGNHIHSSQAFGKYRGTGVPTVALAEKYSYNGKLYTAYRINADNEVHVTDAYYPGVKVVEGPSDVAKTYVWAELPKEATKDTMEFKSGYNEYVFNGIKYHVYKQKDDEEIGMISAKGDPMYKALQGINEIDDDRLHYCKVNCNFFDNNTSSSEYGQHFGVEISLQNEFVPRQAEWMCAYVSAIDNSFHVCESTDFWLSKDAVKFACSPAAVPLLDGVNRQLYSPAVGFSNFSASTERTFLGVCSDGKFVLGISAGKVTCYDVRNFCKEYGCVSCIILDGGGSAQMKANGKVIKNTGRKIANVLTLYKKEIPDQKPEKPVEKPEENQPEIEDPKSETPSIPEIPSTPNKDLTEKINSWRAKQLESLEELTEILKELNK